MKILVVGEPVHLEETRQKLGEHDFVHASDHQAAAKSLAEGVIVFDFLTSEAPESFQIYIGTPVIVFLNAWRHSLAELCLQVRRNMKCRLFGFNGFPTMFNREFLEVSLLHADDEPELKKICGQLQSGFMIVDDRVGLVTPRVISMIINEAYYTVQEGTASREDIDLAMKLGTNYPYGPFEWCERIGLKNVYHLLEAVYNDTKDERYKVSALMKKEFLSQGA